jgi:hypothetical protein
MKILDFLLRSKMLSVSNGLSIPGQDLYSKENAGLICISQLFGTFQFWCFIAGMFTFERDDGTTTYGYEKRRSHCWLRLLRLLVEYEVTS